MVHGRSSLENPSIQSRICHSPSFFFFCSLDTLSSHSRASSGPICVCPCCCTCVNRTAFLRCSYSSRSATVIVSSCLRRRGQISLRVCYNSVEFVTSRVLFFSWCCTDLSVLSSHRRETHITGCFWRLV